jgi:hypothetical protein
MEPLIDHGNVWILSNDSHDVCDVACVPCRSSPECPTAASACSGTMEGA